MAARKDEAEPVVFDRCGFVVVGGLGCGGLEPVCDFRECGVVAGAASNRIDGAEAAGRNEPGARVVRDAALGPLLGGGGEGLLQGILGELKIAKQADEGGEDAAGFGAVCFGEDVRGSWFVVRWSGLGALLSWRRWCPIAQLAERLTLDQEVPGSNPGRAALVVPMNADGPTGIQILYLRPSLAILFL